MNWKSWVAIFLVAGFVNSCSGGGNEADKVTEDAPKAPVEQTQKAAPASSEIQGGDCASLVTALCTDCHHIARVCQKLGKKSKKRWVRTMKRMVKRGAKMSAAEMETITECLAQESADVQAICE